MSFSVRWFWVSLSGLARERRRLLPTLTRSGRAKPLRKTPAFLSGLRREKRRRKHRGEEAEVEVEAGCFKRDTVGWDGAGVIEKALCFYYYEREILPTERAAISTPTPQSRG